MDEKKILVKEVSEEKKLKDGTVEDYYEAESWQFSGCGD